MNFEIISKLLDEKAETKINTLSSDLSETVQAWVENCCEELGIQYNHSEYRQQFESDNIRSIEKDITQGMKESLMEQMIEDLIENLSVV